MYIYCVVNECSRIQKYFFPSGLKSKTTSHMLVDSLGPAKIVMSEEEIKADEDEDMQEEDDSEEEEEEMMEDDMDDDMEEVC